MVKAKLKSAGSSDPGRVRRNNEDAFHVDPERGIFFVVDGIGGQNAGEKAAEIAVDRLRARLERQTGTPEQRIREAIAMANNEIFRAARSNPEWDGMACVLTLALLENGSAIVGHVGDSRLYLLERGQIRKITHDHSPVGEREDARELSEAEAMRHPRRNEVYRDVGSEEHTPDDPDFIEIQRIPFEPASALLLCSDGLSDQVASEDIRRAVERHAGKPEAAVRELIAAANEAGGKDNVTIVIVEGEQFMPEPPVPVEAVAPPPVRPRRVPYLLAGLLLGAAATFGVLEYLGWRPPLPPEPPPRVLAVGQGQPFATIADALSKARPGDTVEALAGDYREQVRLKPGVTVRSRVPREAVLLAVAMNDAPAVVAENTSGARISGFLIRADPQAPLSAAIVLTSSDVTVENMEISGAGVGIEVRGGSPTILGNSIHDCLLDGIVVTASATPWVLHNTIRRNKGAAIAAKEGARPALRDNVFEKNPLSLPPEIPLDAVRAQNVFLDTATPPRRPAPPRL